MTRKESVAVLEATVGAVDPLLRRHLERRDICILATCLAVNALRANGYQAVPFACRATIFNPLAVAKLEEGVELRDLHNTEEGTWSVGLGFEPRNNPRPGWAGHLVVRLGGAFADLTLDQASRPQHGMKLAPAVFCPTGKNFWKPGNAEQWRTPTNIGLVYEALDDRSFLTAPDWTRLREARGIRAEAAAAIREALK